MREIYDVKDSEARHIGGQRVAADRTVLLTAAEADHDLRMGSIVKRAAKPVAPPAQAVIDPPAASLLDEVPATNRRR